MQKEKTTVEKGDDLELDTLKIIEDIINREILGLPRKYLKIEKKKKYPSNIRSNDIEFDFTIEFWPPGADRYSLLYIIECKNYTGRVPVSEIQSFHSQLIQVNGFNIKGIIITNSPLQQGGYDMAVNLGLMFIQADNGKYPKVVLYKANKPEATLTIPFMRASYDKERLDVGSIQMEKIIDQKILSAFQEPDDKSKINYGIDLLRKEDIETIANNELNKINFNILKSAEILSIKELLKYIMDTYSITVKYFDGNSERIGFFDANERIIGISSTIKNTNREFFTLAHEFGHFLLHSKLEINQVEYDNFEDVRLNFRHENYDLKNPKHWIEWQANHFACSFLMPASSFIAHRKLFQQRMGMGDGIIYYDDQPQNIKDFNALVSRLALRFSVSKTSIFIRLKKLNCINNKSRLKSIGEIMGEDLHELYIDI